MCVVTQSTRAFYCVNIYDAKTTHHVYSQACEVVVRDLCEALDVTMAGSACASIELTWLLKGCGFNSDTVPFGVVRLLCTSLRDIMRGMVFVSSMKGSKRMKSVRTDEALFEVVMNEKQRFCKVNGGHFFVDSQRRASVRAFVELSKLISPPGTAFKPRMVMMEEAFNAWREPPSPESIDDVTATTTSDESTSQFFSRCVFAHVSGSVHSYLVYHCLFSLPNCEPLFLSDQTCIRRPMFCR